jgi:hypothetical protein
METVGLEVWPPRFGAKGDPVTIRGLVVRSPF